MAYGALIKNGNGNDILDPNNPELVYHYWGQKTLSVSADTVDSISLFNIPESWRPIVYARTNQYATDLLNNETCGSWIGYYTSTNRLFGAIERTRNVPGTVSTTFYVFVPSTYTPTPTYGMKIWNSSGQLGWHNGRIPLQVRRVMDFPYTGTPLNVGFNGANSLSIESAWSSSYFSTTWWYVIYPICSGTTIGRGYNVVARGSLPSLADVVMPYQTSIIDISKYPSSYPNLGSVTFAYENRLSTTSVADSTLLDWSGLDSITNIGIDLTRIQIDPAFFDTNGRLLPNLSDPVTGNPITDRFGNDLTGGIIQ